MGDLGIGNPVPSPLPTPRPPSPAATPPPSVPVRRDSLALGNEATSRPGGARDVATATREAQAVFLSPRTVEEIEAKRAAKRNGDLEAAKAIGYVEVGLGQHDWRLVERDVIDANYPDPKADWRNLAIEAAATRQLAQNQALETAARERLAPEDRARYDAVAAAVGDNVASRLALQLLLVEGRLQPELLGNLDALATTAPLDPAIDRGQLLGHVLHEVYVPGSIDQLDFGTCSVTTLQILTAMHRPAEYVRLVTGLAGDGVTLANGERLTRLPGTESPQDQLDPAGNASHDERTISSRLWQSAFLEYGAQHGAKPDHYDVVHDLLATGGSAGLDASQVEAALKALTGLGARHESLPEDQLKLMTASKAALDELAGAKEPARIAEIQARLKDLSKQLAALPVVKRAKMMQDLEAAAARGPVPVSVDQWRQLAPGVSVGTHELLVTKVTADRVYFSNPQGTEESAPRAEFEARLASIVISE